MKKIEIPQISFTLVEFPLVYLRQNFEVVRPAAVGGEVGLWPLLQFMPERKPRNLHNQTNVAHKTIAG